MRYVFGFVLAVSYWFLIDKAQEFYIPHASYETIWQALTPNAYDFLSFFAFCSAYMAGNLTAKYTGL